MRCSLNLKFQTLLPGECYMCGVFGIASAPIEHRERSVLSKIFLGLLNLEHRGGQGCGIATSDGSKLRSHRAEGRLEEVFSEKSFRKLSRMLLGSYGIGHTLYSTVGCTGEKRQSKTFQPLVGKFHGRTFALVHNGNLIHLPKLRTQAKKDGYRFRSQHSDTEVIVALLETSRREDFLEALQEVLPVLQRAFSLIFLYENKVIGVRDRFGIRPLCVGRSERDHMLASESCAFYRLEASLIRDVQPGEIIVLGAKGIERSTIWAHDATIRRCVLELVYFSRPDSQSSEGDVYSYRDAAGKILAREHPAEHADIVVPVPESGRIYGGVFAAEQELPTKEGLCKNRNNVKRAFLASRHANRGEMQKHKLHPLPIVVRGKNTCFVDDSLIRGSVSPEIVQMLRRAGALRVDVRIGSAPIKHRCFLGIDIPSEKELIAAGRTVEQVRNLIGADSLGYLSLEGMIAATGLPKENLCLGCFTGEYPVEPERQ